MAYLLDANVFMQAKNLHYGIPASSSFTLAAEGAKGKNNTVLTGFSRMITTRGSAYCFLPSLSGLRYLARLPAASGSR